MPHAGARTRRRAFVGVVAAALAFSACSSSSGSNAGSNPSATEDHTLPLLTKAAEATGAGQGVARGRMELGRPGALTGTTYSVRWQGTFADGRGTATGHLPGASGAALEARWTGGSIYLHRTATEADLGNSPLGQLAAVLPGTALWTTVPAASTAARVVTPLSPADLLTALAVNGKETETDGPTVAGSPTRKLVVVGSVGLVFNWAGPKRAEVLLDQQGRARRITVTYQGQTIRLDVAYTKSTPTVTPPSAADLALKTPAPITPIGPYRTVRTGTDQGVAWTLQQAPGRNGSTCWRWSSTPPLAVVQPSYLTDTRCVAAPSPNDDLADQINFVLWTDGTKANTAAVVAVVPPSLTQATLGFVGGTTAPAAIDNGLLVWVGPSSASLGYVGFDHNGTQINCGIGAVSSPGDLSNDSLVGDGFHAPWSCQS
jgi:hypothetical protein